MIERSTPSSRIDSVDIVRGIVMVLMAIDHVRLYGGVPAGGPTPGLFFTRWVTHFCAPVFVMFAGTGAFFYGKTHGDRGALTRYLLARGLLLVVLDLTLVRFFWTFNLNWSNFILTNIVWTIGWSMVLLAAAVFAGLSPRLIGMAGVLIVLLQQLFGFGRSTVWQFIYPTTNASPFGMNVLFVLVPWVGVLMAGYGFGLILSMEPAARRRWCLRIGFGMTALFVVIATIVAIVNAPTGPNVRPLWMRILAQQKYPASQLFLMMTLGPAIALLPFVEGARGAVSRVFRTFGRVPMFFYLLHILLIHVATLITAVIRGDGVHHNWYATAPFASVPATARWPLWQLYLVWAIVVAILYLVCAWYAKVKTEKPARWMSYV